MGKIERAIQAIEALPAHRREEVAEMVLELTQAIQGALGESALSEYAAAARTASNQEAPAASTNYSPV